MSSKIESLMRSARISALPKRPVCKVDPTTTLGDVYERLEREHSVAVLVFDGAELVGIFTERDILNRTSLEGDVDTPIGELMMRGVVTIEEDARLSEAITVMSERGIRHLPLCREGKADGTLIGGRDVLKLVADYYPETLLNLPPRLHQKLMREDGG